VRQYAHMEGFCSVSMFLRNCRTQGSHVLAVRVHGGRYGSCQRCLKFLFQIFLTGCLPKVMTYHQGDGLTINEQSLIKMTNIEQSLIKMT
jgi:hypothetical protein